MTKFGKLVVGVVAVLVIGVGGYFAQKQPAMVGVEDTIIPTTEEENLAQNNPVPEVPITNPSDSDLVSFSIKPNAKVHGIVSYRGVIKGGYFFEANILINILDAKKKLLKASNAMAKTNWMTSGPVEFEGNIDFTSLPVGPAYFEIHNDNASGLPENNKSVLIPIVIEKSEDISATYVYKNHGIEMQLPKEFTPQQEQAQTGPALMITLPTGVLTYISNASFWETNNIPSYTYMQDKKIGTHTFKVYTYAGTIFYWFKTGNAGYEFSGTDTAGLEKILQTFKIVN